MTGSDWGWWRDRRPAATRLRLDTAAAGRSSRAVLAAAAAHAEREAQTGGYVAAAEAEPVLAEGRAALGKLLRISPHVDVIPDDLTRLRQALLTLA
ncbi:MAG TPA: hypothetical protein VFW50_39485 [Streptosporangiaceae bacterium]|nr:hypothetical protein [Streptosporangiaceae bacterium]